MKSTIVSLWIFITQGQKYYILLYLSRPLFLHRTFLGKKFPHYQVYIFKSIVVVK